MTEYEGQRETTIFTGFLEVQPKDQLHTKDPCKEYLEKIKDAIIYHKDILQYKLQFRNFVN